MTKQDLIKANQQLQILNQQLKVLVADCRNANSNLVTSCENWKKDLVDTKEKLNACIDVIRCNLVQPNSESQLDAYAQILVHMLNIKSGELDATS